MTKNNIMFRNFSVIIIALVFFVFLITLFYQRSNYLFTRVLTAMSVSGFVGMFGSFFLTLLDQYLKRNNYHICVLCRKKEFTASLMQGIQDYFVQKPNAKADFFAYDHADTNSAIETFLKNDAHKYDGVVLIPDVIVTEGVYEGIKELLVAKKPIILLDQNLSIEQQDNLNTKLKPVYVCSDFDQGGRAIAEYIHSYVKVNRKDQTRVILLAGPNRFNSLMTRGKSLLYGLGEKNLQRITEIITFDSMHLEHIEDNLRIISNKIKDWDADPFMQLEDKHLLIYCGNDTLANYMIRQMDDKNTDNLIKNYFMKATEIIFIGYDGIQGIDEKYELERYGYPFVTVDVMLKSQGRLGAEILYNLFENREKTKYRNIELIQPRLVVNTNNKTGIFNHKIIPQEINQILTDGEAELSPVEWTDTEFSA